MWEGVWRGLGVWGQSGGSGVSQNPREVRAAVFWGSGAGLVALKRSRGCGTVGGPSGGLEQQPPTNSTSRLQHTAGQASGGVGSEQSLPESDLAKKKNLLLVWLLWHVPKASKGCEAVVLVALGRCRGWERGIHGCGTVGGPSGGLEQQPPTNSTSRLQYTAGEASGGVGSEQSLRKTSSHNARRSWVRMEGGRSSFLGHFGTIPASVRGGPRRSVGGLWGSGYSGTSQRLARTIQGLKSSRRAGRGALKRSRGCGTVGGPSGGLEQQPPTNSTSRLQHTAGQASGGVGSEQSLPESDLAKKKNLLLVWLLWHVPKASKGCEAVVLVALGRSRLGEGYPRLWNCGGSERGSGTTTPYKLHQQTPVHRRGGQRGGRV